MDSIQKKKIQYFSLSDFEFVKSSNKDNFILPDYITLYSEKYLFENEFRRKIICRYGILYPTEQLTIYAKAFQYKVRKYILYINNKGITC